MYSALVATYLVTRYQERRKNPVTPSRPSTKEKRGTGRVLVHSFAIPSAAFPLMSEKYKIVKSARDRTSDPLR
jgi:hypothetical protein